MTSANTKPQAGDGPDPVGVSDTIEYLPLSALRPAQINDVVYKPVSHDDPAIIKLASSIKEKGRLLEPIVRTLDNVIVSGHRRYAACAVAGLDPVPTRTLLLHSTDPRFESYLVDFNTQRVKSLQETIREECVRTSPEDAHLALLANRKTDVQKSLGKMKAAQLRAVKCGDAARRSNISEVKQGMLAAALKVANDYKSYWPLTLRQIHYRLLNRNVLRNSKTNLKYTNTQDSYKDLSDLLSRARINGDFPYEAMHDPTRPRTDWRQWPNAGDYMREQLDGFLTDYRRDLLQSQPAYIELIVEKLTVQEIAERAAGSFFVPVGVGRGYASVTSLAETADRFHMSGKSHFILLIASDLDPEGENIAETWAACLRDEHGCDDLTVIKVALNPEHVAQYGLAPLPMKDTSSRADTFAAEHGTAVYELEAFEPDVLQRIIREAIQGVIDLDLFNEEQRREAEDARQLMAVRSQTCEFLKGATGDAEAGELDEDEG